MAIQYDPNLPVYPDTAKYVAPDLKDPAAELGQTKPIDSYIDPTKATVGGQMKGLLAEDSDYIKAAQADAAKTANNRGLINSGMAATAGTKAAIDSALPIAQQDAALYGSMSKVNQQTDNTGLLSTQNARQTQNLTENAAKIAGAQTEQQFTNQISAAGFAGGIQKQIAQMQITSAEKIALTQAISSQTNTLMSNIGSLLNNPDIEMNDNAVSWMSDFMYSSMSGISSLFNLDIAVT